MGEHPRAAWRPRCTDQSAGHGPDPRRAEEILVLCAFILGGDTVVGVVIPADEDANNHAGDFYLSGH